MAQVFPHLHVIILAEDYGAQLWPITREQAPSCLAPLTPDSSKSLLVATIERVRSLTTAPLHVVTTEQLAPLIEKELRGPACLGEDELDLLVEPLERGSAFAIALACARVRRYDPAAIIAVFPSNQALCIDERWEHLIRHAYNAAQGDRIVVVGAQQERHVVGFSYFRQGKRYEGADDVFEVRSFRFNVQPAVARRAHVEGALWYTGIFFARATAIIGDLTQSAEQDDTPEIRESRRIAETANFLAMLDADDILRDDARAVIGTLPYANFERVVLEKSKRLVVVPTTISILTINKLEDLEGNVEPDDSQNRVIGLAYALDSRNTTLYAQDEKRCVVGLGLQDTFIVDVHDALLVANKRKLENIDAVLETLRVGDVLQLKDFADTSSTPAQQLLTQTGQKPNLTTPKAGILEQAREVNTALTAPHDEAKAFSWGSARVIDRDTLSTTWHVELRGHSMLEGFLLPHAFGYPDALLCEQYVVIAGSVEIASIQEQSNEHPYTMATGDAFENDLDDPLRITNPADAIATLILTVIRK